MRPKVSIVVVAYNVEHSIEKCLDSLRNQTLSDIEVLIVNDGSTDRTGNICARFTEKDLRFRLIEQQNQGLSAARNRGIKEATSEYIAFVDGDDYVAPDMYEKLHASTMSTSAGLVICGYQKVWPQDRTKDKNYYVKAAFLKQEPLHYFLTKHNEALVVVWNKLFKRSVILDRQLAFENRTFFEDVGFMARYICFVEKIQVIHEPLYMDVQYPSAMTKTYNPLIEASHLNTIDLLRNFFRDTQYEQDVHVLELQMYLYRYHYCISTNDDYAMLIPLVKEIKQRRRHMGDIPLKHKIGMCFIQFKLYPVLYSKYNRKLIG